MQIIMKTFICVHLRSSVAKSVLKHGGTETRKHQASKNLCVFVPLCFNSMKNQIETLFSNILLAYFKNCRNLIQELTIKPSNYAFLHSIGVERRYPLVPKQLRLDISSSLPRKIPSTFCHTFTGHQNHLLIH